MGSVFDYSWHCLKLTILSFKTNITPWPASCVMVRKEPDFEFISSSVLFIFDIISVLFQQNATLRMPFCLKWCATQCTYDWSMTQPLLPLVQALLDLGRTAIAGCHHWTGYVYITFKTMGYWHPGLFLTKCKKSEPTTLLRSHDKLPSSRRQWRNHGNCNLITM